MAILWREEYSIGLEVIDEQHKKFIEILNILSQSFIKRGSKKKIAQVLDHLEQYADSHFAFEEKYFEKFHYEDAEKHAKGHEFFRIQIGELRKKFESGDVMLQFDLFEFMEGWIEVHVQQEDKKFVECFKKNGLT
jgi:hemerythrin